jgi:hypothetical protein
MRRRIGIVLYLREDLEDFVGMRLLSISIGNYMKFTFEKDLLPLSIKKLVSLDRQW